MNTNYKIWDKLHQDKMHRKLTVINYRTQSVNKTIKTKNQVKIINLTKKLSPSLKSILE